MFADERETKQMFTGVLLLTNRQPTAINKTTAVKTKSVNCVNTTFNMFADERETKQMFTGVLLLTNRQPTAINKTTAVKTKSVNCVNTVQS